MEQFYPANDKSVNIYYIQIRDLLLSKSLKLNFLRWIRRVDNVEKAVSECEDIHTH